MDEINHIKYLRDNKGHTLRGIARETGHVFETVKKYAQKQDFNINHQNQMTLISNHLIYPMYLCRRF